MKSKKCLIAYYSRKGDNYMGGKIVNLKIGNTEVIAGMIQEMTGGDLFRIDTVHPYPAGYTDTIEAAKKEMREQARPKLNARVEDMDAYDYVFLGYPNWWGTMPMPVFTFLEAYNFSGKTIIPFCTHEGSGLGRSERDIAVLCPQATVLKGLDVYGSQAQHAGQVVAAWLERLNFAADA